MCQEANVVAVATLTPKDGKIVYKGRDGKMNTKEIKIVKNANNSEYYGGEISLIDNSDLRELRESINGSLIQKLQENPGYRNSFSLMILYF